jgi:hypothetical protein
MESVDVLLVHEHLPNTLVAKDFVHTDFCEQFAASSRKMLPFKNYVNNGLRYLNFQL